MNISASIDCPRDPFFQVYDRQDVAHGMQPSSILSAYLKQVKGCGRALDLGAGAGRDSLALAKAGYEVTCVDCSRRGLERIKERAALAGYAGRISTVCSDVRKISIEPRSLNALIATTVLDHIDEGAAASLWRRMTQSLRPGGFMYCQVHTTDDPGCDHGAGRRRTDPVSETAAMVVNYFLPNQLAKMAMASDSQLRVLRYEERLEWDRTHGPEHLHGMATLLAVHSGSYPDWYGYPREFPRP